MEVTKHNDKSEETADLIDFEVCKLLKKHRHTDEFVKDIYSLLSNIFCFYDDPVLIKSLSMVEFLNAKKKAEELTKKLVKEECYSEETSLVPNFLNLSNAYTVDLAFDLQCYLKQINYKHMKSENVLKVNVYYDDIMASNPLSSHRVNGMLTHCAYALVDTTRTSSKLVHFRTFSVCPTADLKRDKYASYFEETINVFKSTKIVHLGTEFSINVHSILGDHPIMSDLFKWRKNYGCKGVNSCRGCKVDAKNYHLYTECSLVQEQLRNCFGPPYVPMWNHLISDSFHDISEGILANMVFSAINNFLIITKFSPQKLRDEIILLSNEFDCSKTIKCVLKKNVFELSKIRKDINKKGRFTLTGSQQNILGRLFYEFLNTYLIMEEDKQELDGKSSKKLKQHLCLLHSVLSLLYLMESFDNDVEILASKVKKTVDNFFKILKATYSEEFKLSIKYHCILHYPQMILHFGAPFYLSCKRFESSNRRVKTFASISNNKVNLGFTVIKKSIFDTILDSLIHKNIANDPVSLLRLNWNFIKEIDENLLETTTLDKEIEEKLEKENRILYDSIANEDYEI
uniref:DUF4806 domain-containing protein n=1 Tax=Parastrongyloides trichosuri TaxID=131310 RepID=A0A0N4ZJL7_PARTI